MRVEKNKYKNFIVDKTTIAEDIFNSPICYQINMNLIKDGDIINIKALTNIRNIKSSYINLSEICFEKVFDSTYSKEVILIKNFPDFKYNKLNNKNNLEPILDIGFTLQPLENDILTNKKFFIVTFLANGMIFLLLPKKLYTKRLGLIQSLSQFNKEDLENELVYTVISKKAYALPIDLRTLYQLNIRTSAIIMI